MSTAVLDDLVLSLTAAATPPAPLGGGAGARRRVRRALWGVAPVAAAPEVWPEGPARGRLVRAATLTSVMGLAWASTTTPADVPRPGVRTAEAGTEPAVAGDHPAPLVTSWVRYIQDGAEQATLDGLEAADAGDTTRAPAPADATTWRDHVLATHEGVDIVQPSPHVPLVGFHEAADPTAKPLDPAATPDAQLGADEVDHADVADDLDTMVLPTRNRASTPATSIDVAVRAGRRVHAPVSGTVTAVQPYLLYGRHPDTRIVIQPDGRPDLQLVVLHVTGHDVAVGDRVEAGRTVLAASATPFPFESQIDRFTTEEIGTATPHVHLELQSTPPEAPAG